MSQLDRKLASAWKRIAAAEQNIGNVSGGVLLGGGRRRVVVRRKVRRVGGVVVNGGRGRAPVRRARRAPVRRAPVRRVVGVVGRPRQNRWITFVKKYWRAHPSLSYREA